MPPELLAQFPLVEEALIALGVKVWPMVELEADDALASAAAVAADDPGVDQVAIWTPDKDLGQCVVGTRVVQVDRRSGKVIDAAGVEAKFGVPPASIPDYLALVGDSADGFPGLQGWGAKSAAAVLHRYGHIEDIPADVADWDGVNVRSAGTLAATLVADRDHALLFKDLATLRVDRSLLDDVDQLRWRRTTPVRRRVRPHRRRRPAGAPPPSTPADAAGQRGIQQLQVVRPADLDGAEALEVRRAPLHVEQRGPGAVQAVDQGHQGHLGGVGGPVEHRLTGEQAVHGDAVEPAGQVPSSSDQASTLWTQPSSCRRV